MYFMKITIITLLSKLTLFVYSKYLDDVKL